MIVRKQGDWLSAKVGDELVMMSAEKGDYLGLSEVGARIWELIETPQAIDAVCARLLDEYDVTPEVCRTEVENFLTELTTHGAIAIDLPPVGQTSPG
jgi:Coenzyme PQQ synthesis protein D (PqqD)